MNKRSTCVPEDAATRIRADAAAGLLKALANEQRLLILCHLLGGRASVGEINAHVPLSQSALSQHLGVLRAASLVATHRESQTIYYELEPGPALEIMGVLYRSFCAPHGRTVKKGVGAGATRPR
ncbi:MAG: winged helix-turn-helix transcriptional regulator [Gammaproteobacteria bacterium]|nr:winged helix-turn-helix transcriptional regulator [Gammaproteobacteria bacterium]MDE2349059.1 winged helix-turn-helix transcriptional regulator [Gammaproteobacteria bacterium]